MRGLMRPPNSKNAQPHGIPHQQHAAATALITGYGLPWPACCCPSASAADAMLCCAMPCAMLSVLCCAQDFEIDLDDDTGPTPAPRAAPAMQAGLHAAAAPPGSASKTPGGPPAAARAPSLHMQYVRPGLEPQQQQFPGPPSGGMAQQGSGAIMGHSSGQMGAPHQQQQQQHFNLPVPGGGMMQQQLPGPPPGQVPGPRPPPGGPKPPSGKPPPPWSYEVTYTRPMSAAASQQGQ